MSISDYLEPKLLDHVFQLKQALYTAPTALWVSLHTEDVADDGSGAEISYTGYARIQHDSWNAAASRASTNDGAIVFAQVPAGESAGTATHWGLWDAIAGNLLFHGAFENGGEFFGAGAVPYIGDELLVVSWDAGTIADGGISDFLANELLDHVLKVGNYAGVTASWVGLYNTAPMDDDSGTELSGANYARIEVQYDSEGEPEWHTASGATFTNDGDIQFAAATGAWLEINYITVHDDDGTPVGNLLIWFPSTNTPVLANTDDFKIAAGAFVGTIS